MGCALKKILLVAMPHRNQWKKNSVGRDEASRPMEFFP
jgi:hypothetical protein